MLRDQLVGHVVTLRHFYSADEQTYDANGALRGHSEIGPWTTDGIIQITGLKVSGSRLTIEANRIFVTWSPAVGETRKIQYSRAFGHHVLIEVELEPTRANAPSTAVTKLFLTKGENLSQIVPDLWREYFNPKESTKPADASPAPGAKPSTRTVTLGQGTTEGKLRKKVVPEYPDLAKEFRAQGTVALHAIIDTDGTVRSLRVKEPVGMGLDEAAADAVSQWKYAPYTYQGRPIQVDTMIIVNYNLDR
ncbi:MAG TPA: energy transducer TonB [Terriglobales bacterium]|nr:energy transducer TonB [Terriglobales bacterium]